MSGEAHRETARTGLWIVIGIALLGLVSLMLAGPGPGGAVWPFNAFLPRRLRLALLPPRGLSLAGAAGPIERRGGGAAEGARGGRWSRGPRTAAGGRPRAAAPSGPTPSPARSPPPWCRPPTPSTVLAQQIQSSSAGDRARRRARSTSTATELASSSFRAGGLGGRDHGRHGAAGPHRLADRGQRFDPG